MPKVSIIIPVFNGEKTIAETIESVLCQTLQEFEVVAIDDGSQDRTVAILNQYSDPRIEVFSFSNAGLAASRNRGIDRATGEYLTFLDADDLWTPDKVEAQYQALQNHPEAAVAYSWTDFIDEHGKALHPGSHVSVSGDVYAALLVHNFIESGSNIMVRRAAFQTVGTYDETLKAAEDWDMSLRLAARYSFVAVPAPQVLYRQPTRSMSANITRQEKACLQVLEKAFATVPNIHRNLKSKSLANLYQYLTFKAMTGNPQDWQSAIALRCFARAIVAEPEILWKRSRLTAIMTAKIFMGLLLPAQIIQFCMRSLDREKEIS
ncbi:glycosyltransferase [bacterium]|nr:glycosyltransferase [bacterium]